MRLDGGLSQRKTAFDPEQVHAGSVVDEVELGQIYLPGFRFSPINTIPPMLHSNINLNSTVIRRTSGGTLKVTVCSISKQHCTENYFYIRLEGVEKITISLEIHFQDSLHHVPQIHSMTHLWEKNNALLMFHTSPRHSCYAMFTF